MWLWRSLQLRASSNALLLERMNLQAVLDAPGWRLKRDKMLLKQAVSSQVAQILSAKGHDVSVSAEEGMFGGTEYS